MFCQTRRRKRKQCDNRYKERVTTEAEVREIQGHMSRNSYSLEAGKAKDQILELPERTRSEDKLNIA